MRNCFCFFVFSFFLFLNLNPAQADLGDLASDYAEASSVGALVRAIQKECRGLKCPLAFKGAFRRLRGNALAHCANAYELSNPAKAGQCRTAVRMVHVTFGAAPVRRTPPAARNGGKGVVKAPPRRRVRRRRYRRRGCRRSSRPDCQNGNAVCNPRTRRWYCNCIDGWKTDEDGICKVRINPPPTRPNDNGNQGTVKPPATHVAQPHGWCIWKILFFILLGLNILYFLIWWWLRRKRKADPNSTPSTPAGPTHLSDSDVQRIADRVSQNSVVLSSGQEDKLLEELLSRINGWTHAVVDDFASRVPAPTPQELDLRVLQVALYRALQMTQEEVEELEGELIAEAEAADATPAPSGVEQPGVQPSWLTTPPPTFGPPAGDEADTQALDLGPADPAPQPVTVVAEETPAEPPTEVELPFPKEKEGDKDKD